MVVLLITTGTIAADAPKVNNNGNTQSDKTNSTELFNPNVLDFMVPPRWHFACVATGAWQVLRKPLGGAASGTPPLLYLAAWFLNSSSFMGLWPTACATEVRPLGKFPS